MKKINTIVLVFTLSLIFCTKENANDQSDCSNRFSLLVDKDWFSSDSETDTLPVIRFDSNGDYFKNEIYTSTWKIEADCTAILFFVADLQSLEFQYDILSISSNTLKIRELSGVILTYHTLSYLIG